MCGVMTQVTLVEAFKSLPLTRLRLRIDVHDVNPLRESSYSRFIRIMAGFPQPPASHPLPPCVAEASAACVSVPVIMRALCAAVPTLVDALVFLRRRSSGELLASIASSEFDLAAEESDDEDVNWARMPADADAMLPISEEETARRMMFELDCD